MAVNRSRETAFDVAQKAGHTEIASILQQNGVQSAKSMAPATANGTRELKQTVSDIKHEVHHQLKQTRQTRKGVHHIRRRLNKMHTEGLNNAINSSTVVAVLIATVAFAAIFTLPGQFVDNAESVPLGFSLGEAHIGNKVEFVVFFISDSIALFISLAVVVVQTSVVVIERKEKKQLMAIINKLMWLACVMISVAFLSLSYIVVGKEERWLAITVTVVGTIIMTTTLGTMCYWVIGHRMEASRKRSLRKSSLSTRSQSGSMSAMMSDTEMLSNEFNKKLYAI